VREEDICEEDLRNAIEQIENRVGMETGQISQDNLSRKDLGLYAHAKVFQAHDGGVVGGDIQKAINRVGASVEFHRSKARVLAEDILTRIGSESFYHYLLLRKKLGLTKECFSLSRFRGRRIGDCISLVNPGGTVWVSDGTYGLTAPISFVGGGPGPPSKTVALLGAGRWATVFRADADINAIEGLNSASVCLQHFYVNMNNKNGCGIKGLNTGATWDRSFQKSDVRDLEIRNTVAGYWSMHLINPYITNTWDNIYMWSAGGGLLAECTSTGYGNNHFGNLMVAVFGLNGVGVKFLKSGNALSLNSIERLHIDGGASGGLKGNLGLELEGSNYNSFGYLEIEHCKYCVKMGTTQATHGNVIKSGYFYVVEPDGILFQLTSNALRNVVRDVFCAAHSDLTTTKLIDDGNTTVDAPNSYYDLNGSSVGFLPVGQYIDRQSVNACRLYGQMLWRKAQNKVLQNFYLNPQGIKDFTLYHALCLAPPLEGCQVTLARGTEVEDWDAYVMDLHNPTATTIQVRVNVVVASETPLSTANLAFSGDVNG